MIIQAKYRFWQMQADKGERLGFAWAGIFNDRQICIATDGFVLACVPVQLDEADVPGAFFLESKVFESIPETVTTREEYNSRFQHNDVKVQISLGESEIEFLGHKWKRRKFTSPDFEKFLKKIESTLTLTESTQEFIIDLQLLNKLASALDTHRLRFRVTNPESPILIKSKGNEDWLTPPFGIIMPMGKTRYYD